MYKNFLLVIFVFNMFVVSACASYKGLYRTPFNKFDTVTFKSLDIQIDLPEQPETKYARYMVKVYDSEAFQKNTQSKAIVISFHPYWSGQYATEPEYYLVFDIVRTKKFEILFSRFKRLGPIERSEIDDYKKDIDEWMGADEYSGREYYLFQKHIESPNNDIILTGARLLHRPDINIKEKVDIDAIRQIIRSIKSVRK